jgi:Dip2/Utp12 Family
MQETASAADRIIDALDMAADDAERRAEAAYQPNVLMLGLSGPQFVLRAVADVRASDLEATLTTLPYTDALALLEMVPAWLGDAGHVELSVRAAVVLLGAHQAQLRASPAARPLLARLQARLRGRVQALRNVMGYNLAGLQHLHAKARGAAGAPEALPVKRKALGEP